MPTAGLTRDASGNLYGTTLFGGTGAGVVFKVSPTGTETVLYTFTGGADGENPFGARFGTRLIRQLIRHRWRRLGNDGAFPIGPLVRDASGNLYGITESGGASGQRVVFKLDPSGKETVLYTFTWGADGAVLGYTENRGRKRTTNYC